MATKYEKIAKEKPEDPQRYRKVVDVPSTTNVTILGTIDGLKSVRDNLKNKYNNYVKDITECEKL